MLFLIRVCGSITSISKELSEKKISSHCPLVQANCKVWWWKCYGSRLFCCLRAWSTSLIALIESIMNSLLYQIVLEENSRPFEAKKWRVMDWRRQSPGLNFIEMLWGDLKQAVHARNPSNIAQLKRFCMEEWANILAVDIW